MKKVITEPIRSENKIQLTGQVKSIRYNNSLKKPTASAVG